MLERKRTEQDRLTRERVDWRETKRDDKNLVIRPVLLSAASFVDVSPAAAVLFDEGGRDRGGRRLHRVDLLRRFPPETFDEVRITDEGLTRLPGSWKEYHQLRVLDVSVNILKSLPDGLEHLRQLEVLRADHNQLLHLPSCLSSLQQLRELSARSNQIQYLPNLLGMHCLHTLNLSDNKLREVDGSICDLPELSVLRVDHNELLSLPKDLFFLHSLKQLHAQFNFLTSLPPDFHMHKRVEILDLRHNLLRQLPDVKNELESWFPSLHTLDVSNNKLEVFPEALRTGRVKHVNLEHNLLSLI
ncbi:hypothetical protein GUITHDRAFT_146348 [Guillardia theta CCMP2712]|uniref:Uncharacterized protein n=1 Tax=Guillardia theta (strain CCMP2712) TaxID=905079 RepID=L1IH76_GUITC|nr:hypothetical protein GUITHDRAFT_146348 [Guillardia theta CCMP2712]EKX35611.1 hypothetical protein GUITHDRAFT_146348 [Guillardia theta CCMP2712]|eukprot:XP_005822591.1 hypothetical protein GUITHDRAFT_146348 [Guillardia theta CCMP2712]